MFANRVGDGFLAVGQLLPEFCLALNGKQRMGEGVIADGVASLGYLAGDVRTLLDVASDQKKSCRHTMPGEDVQQTQRMRVIRPVVVGERELFGSRSKAGEGAAVPLTGRRHGLISGHDRSRRHRAR